MKRIEKWLDKNLETGFDDLHWLGYLIIFAFCVSLLITLAYLTYGGNIE